MSTKNTHPVGADGKDKAVVLGYGTLDYRISMRDFLWAQEELRKAGLPSGGPANTAGAATWPFDGVIARE